MEADLGTQATLSAHLARVEPDVGGRAVHRRVLRVVMAYSLPVNTVPISRTGLTIATMLVMQVVTNVYYVRAGLWRIIWESESVSDEPVREDNQRTSRLARMER